METGQPQPDKSAQRAALGKRLDAVAWGLFLVMIGVIWLMPEGRVPDCTWLIGAGVILLALNVVRLLVGVRTSGITILLGVIALALGLGDYYGARVPVIPLAVIAVGVVIIVTGLARQRKT